MSNAQEEIPTTRPSTPEPMSPSYHVFSPESPPPSSESSCSQSEAIVDLHRWQFDLDDDIPHGLRPETRTRVRQQRRRAAREKYGKFSVLDKKFRCLTKPATSLTALRRLHMSGACDVRSAKLDDGPTVVLLRNALLSKEQEFRALLENKLSNTVRAYNDIVRSVSIVIRHLLKFDMWGPNANAILTALKSEFRDALRWYTGEVVTLSTAFQANCSEECFLGLLQGDQPLHEMISDVNVTFESLKCPSAEFMAVLPQLPPAPCCQLCDNPTREMVTFCEPGHTHCYSCFREATWKRYQATADGELMTIDCWHCCKTFPLASIQLTAMPTVAPARGPSSDWQRK